MRRTALLPLLALPLVLTACGGEEPIEVTDEDIEAIEQSIVNISTLSWELVQVESRVASMCMQDEGFTVHDPIALFGNGIPNRFTGFASPYARIPTVEQAEKFAFGKWVTWTDTDAALTMREDADYLAAHAEEQGFWEPAWDAEHEEFKAQGEDYTTAWEQAWMGAERYEYQQAFSDAMDAGQDPMELDLEQPPYGGCELETIKVIYGEPEQVEFDDGTSAWTVPGGDNESPLVGVGDGEIYGEMLADYADEEDEFLVCLADRGYGEWEFDEMGWLDTDQYITVNLYGDESIVYEGDERVEVAELPDDFDTGDPVAAEFAIALDFARCAEDSGLRNGSEELYARLYVEKLMPGQTEIYTQEQAVKDQLARAQDYIEGA
ncbi:hypothetical protein [Glycomyces sp. NPDC047010]|uniref:hypothetical protein n=1 Tax=Glycomyces sp. NPDC047010 TaxID=3155023 RepID=UPI003410565C